jgi:hypothetical protein
MRPARLRTSTPRFARAERPRRVRLGVWRQAPQGPLAAHAGAGDADRVRQLQDRWAIAGRDCALQAGSTRPRRIPQILDLAVETSRPEVCTQLVQAGMGGRLRRTTVDMRGHRDDLRAVTSQLRTQRAGRRISVHDRRLPTARYRARHSVSGTAHVRASGRRPPARRLPATRYRRWTQVRANPTGRRGHAPRPRRRPGLPAPPA